jgi:hypothetical protein
VADRRPFSTPNIPDTLRKELKDRKPWFIMNLSINAEGDWFMYAFKSTGYYRAWSSEAGPDGLLRTVIDALIAENKKENGLGLCSFGESPGSFFVRACYEQEGSLVWYPRWGLLPWTCSLKLQSKLGGDGWRNGPPRSITFGKGSRWLIYGKNWFEWSDNLPDDLRKALRSEQVKGSTINVSTPDRMGFTAI